MREQNEMVRDFFSGFAGTWDSLYGEKRRNFFWRAFDRAFRRDVYERYVLTFDAIGADLSGKSVLDIGCGSGVYCFEAARRGARRVVGVDIAPNMVSLSSENAKKLGYGSVCEFVCSPFPPVKPLSRIDGKFDYTIVMGVMDYVADAEEFLKALRRRVTGSAVLSFPGRHWLREPVRRYRYKALGRCALYSYDERTIRGACSKAGFSKVEINRLDHSGICYFVTARA